VRNVHAIVFTDDAVLIEYSEDSQSPFAVSSQIRIPLRESPLYPQLAQDLNELIQDSATLLDSALAAKVSGGGAQEMGRM
jgi:hypothetical protein